MSIQSLTPKLLVIQIKDSYVWGQNSDALYALGRDEGIQYLKKVLPIARKIEVRFTYGKTSGFSCFKDRKGLWTAQKRINTKLRAKRIGNDLTVAKFTPSDWLELGQSLRRGKV